MVMGPQILTAIFLVTSEKVVKNSLAMIVGVALAASLGLAIWSGVVSAADMKPKPDASGPGTADWVVAGLLALLAIRIWLGRGEAAVPKWMTALQEAEPKRAFSLGFLLILLMPTDIIATISAAHVMHDSGSARDRRLAAGRRHGAGDGAAVPRLLAAGAARQARHAGHPRRG